MSSLDEKLEALAKRFGVSKDKIIEVLLETALKHRSHSGLSLDALEKISKLDVDELVKLRVIERILGTDEIDFNKLYAVLALKIALQPDPTLVAALMNSSRQQADNNHVIQLLQMYMQQQQQLMQMIVNILIGRRSEELEEKLARIVSETTSQQQRQIDELRSKLDELARQMAEELREALKDRESLRQYLAELAKLVREKPDVRNYLREMISTYRELRELFMEAAEELGIKRTEIVKEGGGIDWNALLDRILRIVEKSQAGRAVQQPPPPAMVEKLPGTAPAPGQEAQPKSGGEGVEAGGEGGAGEEASGGKAEGGS